jgi:hypothetical protein
LEYGLKQGLTQIKLTSDTAAGETHTIQVKDLGTQTSSISLTGYRDKVFSLEVNNKLGAGNEYLRITIDNIPLSAGGDLKLNIKPGIGGVELVAAGQVINSTVTLDYVRHNLKLTSRFEISGQDGFRFMPSTFITENQLKVSRINTLFGPSLNSSTIQSMP